MIILIACNPTVNHIHCSVNQTKLQQPIGVVIGGVGQFNLTCMVHQVCSTVQHLDEKCFFLESFSFVSFPVWHW